LPNPWDTWKDDTMNRLTTVNPFKFTIPTPDKNPIIRNMGRVVRTFEFTCQPPARIWFKTLPAAIVSGFATLESPDTKHLIKKLTGRSWLCGAVSTIAHAIPLPTTKLNLLSEFLMTTAGTLEEITFWYFLVGTAIDAGLNWASLARKLSTCGGFGFLDADKVDWGITDNGLWQPILWSHWTKQGIQIEFNGRTCQVPNTSTYSYSATLAVKQGWFAHLGGFDVRIITDSGEVLKQVTGLKCDPVAPEQQGTFDVASFKGAGQTGITVEARIEPHSGDLVFGSGNFVVSAIENMQHG